MEQFVRCIINLIVGLCGFERKKLRALQQAFHELDHDHSGNLTKDHFKIYDKYLKKDKLKIMFDKIDLDKNGTISYHEFITAACDH